MALSLGSVASQPRRLASVVTAASSASRPASSRCFRAPAKSFGRRFRDREASLSGLGFPCEAAGRGAFAGVTENRSGVVSAKRRVGIIQLCGQHLGAATAGFLHAADILSGHLPEAPPGRVKIRQSARSLPLLGGGLSRVCGGLAQVLDLLAQNLDLPLDKLGLHPDEFIDILGLNDLLGEFEG